MNNNANNMYRLLSEDEKQALAGEPTDMLYNKRDEK